METRSEANSGLFLHNAGATYARAKQEVHHKPIDEAWVDIQTTVGSTQSPNTFSTTIEYAHSGYELR